MNVLWITNQPIGEMARRLRTNSASGTWMEPALRRMIKNPGIKMSVVTVADVKSIEKVICGGVSYYCLSRSRKKIYPYSDASRQEMWEKIIREIDPDIMMIWGTEYAHGLCAMLAAPNVPSVILVQGILGSIEKYCLGGLTKNELLHAYSLRNFVKHDSLRHIQKWYAKRAEIEKQMLKLSGNVIVENEWAYANIIAIYDKVHTYEYRQNINELFFQYQWKLENCKRYTIFCTAPVNSPLKGLHQLIKALYIIKRNYPDVQLKVPGMRNPFTVFIDEQFRQDGYVKYIKYLIKEYDLKENILFLGRLNSEQIANELVNANVFIAPSCIENLSTSLREAMAVGTPSIASYVGGIPEIITNKVDGFLYRYEEYEQLAYLVMDLFNKETMAREIGKNAGKKMRNYLKEKSDDVTLLRIYERIINKGDK